MLYHSFMTYLSALWSSVLSHSQDSLGKHWSATLGRNLQGYGHPQASHLGKAGSGWLWFTDASNTTGPHRLLSLDQSRPVLSLKSPWNREAESVHSAVTGIFSSPGSPTAQAAHSSHKQPLLATCMLVAPHFVLPAAVTARAAAPEPSSTPHICPCCAEQGWRADPATAAGNKAQLPAAAALEQVSMDVHGTSFRTHRPSHPYKTFS